MSLHKLIRQKELTLDFRSKLKSKSSSEEYLFLAFLLRFSFLFASFSDEVLLWVSRVFKEASARR